MENPYVFELISGFESSDTTKFCNDFYQPTSTPHQPARSALSRRCPPSTGNHGQSLRYTKQPNKSVFSWSLKKMPQICRFGIFEYETIHPNSEVTCNHWGASHMPSHAWLPLGLPEFMAHLLHPIAHMLHLWGGASPACGVDQPKTANVSILLN